MDITNIHIPTPADLIKTDQREGEWIEIKAKS